MIEHFSLSGKTALVTGGASGIGAAVARLFAQAGALITIIDMNEEQGSVLASGLAGGSFVKCDITNEHEVEALARSMDGLDILVNCAGVGSVGSIEETELQEFERLFRVNVTGTFLMTKALMPLLLGVRGCILNMGSVAGLVGIRRRFAYCASKGAVIAMTRQLAVEYPTQIRVNCIAPGTVDTPFVEGYLEKYHRHEKEKVRIQLNERQPLGRLGRPEEIANLALYVCSSAADFMNGSIVTIDGGWTAA